MGPNTPKNVKMVPKKPQSPKIALSITLIGILLDIIPHIIIKLLAWGLWEVEIVSVSHYAAVLHTKHVKMGSKMAKMVPKLQHCLHMRQQEDK